jgi:hypothetical protein
MELTDASLIPAKPEPRTTSLSLKVRERTYEALGRAAVKHGRSKSSMGEAIIEAWLKAQKYLDEE